MTARLELPELGAETYSRTTPIEAGLGMTLGVTRVAWLSALSPQQGFDEMQSLNYY